MATLSFLSSGFGRGEREGDEGLERTRGGYVAEARRKRGKNEVRLGVCPHGFSGPHGFEGRATQWARCAGRWVGWGDTGY